MAAALNQKLIASVILLTILYSTLIFITYYDIMRQINKSIAQLLPGIAVIIFGIGSYTLFLYPSFVFETILPIKSGFAKTIIGTTIFPYIGASILTLTIISGLTLIIDKLWYFWQLHRIKFFIRIINVIAMIIITARTLFNLVYIDLKNIPGQTVELTIIGKVAGVFLSVLLLLVAILALPHLFKKEPKEPFLESQN